MDQDLLNYLDQRFSSIDQRFQETGQQIQALREENARQFERIDQRLETVDQRLETVDQRLEAVDQRLETVDQRLERVDQRFETVETEIRRAYVAIEGLQSEVRLVAADGIVNVTEQLNRHRDEVSRKFGEIESLNRRVFNELRSSRDDHEVRIRRLEATG
jgi:chromosome segregation ATPase